MVGRFAEELGKNLMYPIIGLIDWGKDDYMAKSYSLLIVLERIKQVIESGYASIIYISTKCT